jgi:hypothetical protein
MRLRRTLVAAAAAALAACSVEGHVTSGSAVPTGAPTLPATRTELVALLDDISVKLRSSDPKSGCRPLHDLTEAMENGGSLSDLMGPNFYNQGLQLRAAAAGCTSSPAQAASTLVAVSGQLR